MRAGHFRIKRFFNFVGKLPYVRAKAMSKSLNEQLVNA